MNASSPTTSTSAKFSYGGPDRRRRRRYMGQDLVCTVDSRPASVHDISEGGLSVAISGVIVGQVVGLNLSIQGSEPVRTTARVLGSDGTRASLAFNAPTYSLMKFVIHYLAEHHGVAVHAFR